jgi:intron-binding protein aquarius
LEIIKEITKELSEGEEFSLTCSNAINFFNFKLKPLLKNYYKSDIKDNNDFKNFPLKKIFFDQIIFINDNNEKKEDLILKNKGIIKNIYKDLKKVIQELKEYSSFEVIKTAKERGRFILNKHSKIITMTCLHAALKRNELINDNFQFDNIIFEESSQILDIEALIPILIQKKSNKLKRIILLGDSNQLPPIIKNKIFEKYSNLNQSLFLRLIKLKNPFIQLDVQYR